MFLIAVTEAASAPRGMAQQSAAGTQQKQERLWLSPHCLRPVAVVPAQASLFAGLA